MDALKTNERSNGRPYVWRPTLSDQNIIGTTNTEGARVLLLYPMASTEVQAGETPEMKSDLSKNCTELLQGIDDWGQLEQILRDVTMYDDRFDQEEVNRRIEGGQVSRDVDTFIEQAPAHFGVVLNKKLITIAIDEAYQNITQQYPDRQFQRSTRAEKLGVLKGLASDENMSEVVKLQTNLDVLHNAEYDLNKPIINEGIYAFVDQVSEDLLIRRWAQEAQNINPLEEIDIEGCKNIEDLLRIVRKNFRNDNVSLLDRIIRNTKLNKGELFNQAIVKAYLRVINKIDLNEVANISVAPSELPLLFKELFTKAYVEVGIDDFQQARKASEDGRLSSCIEGLSSPIFPVNNIDLSVVKELNELREDTLDDPYNFWNQVLNQQANRFAGRSYMKPEEWKQKAFQALTNGSAPIAGWRVFAKEAMAQIQPENENDASTKRSNVATAHGANYEIQIFNVDPDKTRQAQKEIVSNLGYSYVRELSLMKQKFELPEYARDGTKTVEYEANPFGIAEREDERPIWARDSITIHKKVMVGGAPRDLFLSAPATKVLVDNEGESEHPFSFDYVEDMFDILAGRFEGNDEALYFRMDGDDNFSRTFLQDSLQNSSVLLSLPGDGLMTGDKIDQVVGAEQKSGPEEYEEVSELYTQVTKLQQKYRFGGQLIVKIGIGKNGEVGVAHYVDHKNFDGLPDTGFREKVLSSVLRNSNANLDLDGYIEEADKRKNKTSKDLLEVMRDWDEFKWQYRARPLIKKLEGYGRVLGEDGLVELQDQVYGLIDQKKWADREVRGEKVVLLKGHGDQKIEDEVISFYEGKDRDLQHMLQFEFPWDLTQKLEQALKIAGSENNEISANTLGILFNGGVVAPAFEKTMREYVIKEFEKNRVLPMQIRMRELRSRLEDPTILRTAETGHNYSIELMRAIGSLEGNIVSEKKKIAMEVEEYLSFLTENEGIHHLVADDSVDQQLHQVAATKISDVKRMREAENLEQFQDGYNSIKGQIGDSIKQAIVDKHTKNSVFLNLLRRLEPGVLGGALDYSGEYPDQLLDRNYTKRLQVSRIERVGSAFRVPKGIINKAKAWLGDTTRGVLIRSGEDPVRRFIANWGLNIPIDQIARATLQSVGSYQGSTPKNVGEMTGTNKPAILPSSLFGLKVGDIMALIGPAMPEDFYKLLMQNINQECHAFEAHLDRLIDNSSPLQPNF